MIRHLLIATKWALGASVVTGFVLVYAVGGPQSPDAEPMIRIAIFAFFVFLVVFAFLFRPARGADDAAPSAVEGGGEHLRGANKWVRGDVRANEALRPRSEADAREEDAGGDGGH
jgi:hypothetical protein